MTIAAKSATKLAAIVDAPEELVLTGLPAEPEPDAECDLLLERDGPDTLDMDGDTTVASCELDARVDEELGAVFVEKPEVG